MAAKKAQSINPSGIRDITHPFMEKTWSNIIIITVITISNNEHATINSCF